MPLFVEPDWSIRDCVVDVVVREHDRLSDLLVGLNVDLDDAFAVLSVIAQKIDMTSFTGEEADFVYDSVVIPAFVKTLERAGDLVRMPNDMWIAGTNLLV